MDVSITKQALKRLEEQSRLSSNAVARFRRKIYQIIKGQACAGEIAKMGGSDQCIFRIRFNISLRIIATVVKTEQGTQFRILDFVTHDQMDRGQYVTDPIDVLDFENELKDDLEIANAIDFICSNENLQVDESDFEALRDDFYLHVPDPEKNQNPDLWLSSEQKQFVEKEMPVLLTGSAGSGKTTILIYHALRKSLENNNNKVLYVTYNKFLQKEAERIAKEVFPNYPQNLKFCHYLDLCANYVEPSQFNEAKEVNQQRFMNEFYRTRSGHFQDVDPILVWQEIRNLIKGSVFSVEKGRELLALDEYQTKKNESSLTDWSLFRQVHSLANKYQIWLESQGYWDEIDITQNALFNIGNSLKEEDKYSAIYCDEIQDLTKNQISLLLKILKKKHYELPDFFFAGDPAQIINPSGFSWKKVKDLIYNLYNNLSKAQSVEHDELKLNFRSTEGIVNLGRKILEFNDGDTKLVSQEAHRKGGDMPLVVNIAEPDILRDNDDFGSRNAIIVANEQEKSKLKKQFSKDGIESERIFLFTEVKGLEFNEVLVWKFFEHFNSWRTNSKDLENFKYNLLYVCTTRARDKLYFYEGENVHIFWENIAIKPCISITNDYQEIDDFFKKYETPEEILEAAQARERIGKYKLAKELYRKCDYQNDATRMDALICEEAKQFNEATKYWEMSAVGYENDSKWSDAENCWRKLSNWEKVALACENQEKWIDAAKTYEELSNFENAARCYANRKDWSDAERCWRKLPNWEKVAVACENQEKWLDAATTYEEISNFENAARCYTHLKNWAKVERCWRTLSNWENVALACENQGKWLDAALEWEKISNFEKAATAYEKISNFENAARCYTNLKNWAEVERCWRKLSKWEKVALACEKQEKWLNAAIEWKKVSDFEKAADNYRRIDLHKDAIRCLLEVENWQRIEEIYRKSSTLSKFADLCENRENWKTLEKVLTEIYTQRGWQWVSANDGKRLASAQEKNGNLDNAINTWLDYARNPEKAVELLLKQKKWQRALQLTEEINNTQLREKYKNIANLGLQEEKKELESLVQSYQQDEYEKIENYEDYIDDEIEEYKRNYLMNQPDSDETEFSNIKSNYQAPDDDDLDDVFEWDDNNSYYEPPSAFDHIDYGYIMDMSSDYESGLWR